MKGPMPMTKHWRCKTGFIWILVDGFFRVYSDSTRLEGFTANIAFIQFLARRSRRGKSKVISWTSPR